MVRDPLTFESALAASIVQSVATEGLPQGALVLAVVSVPDDDACKAILSHTIVRADKTLACLCQAAADRIADVSFPPTPDLWQMVTRCVWEDFIKRLDFLSSVASVNSWLEFDQTCTELYTSETAHGNPIHPHCTPPPAPPQTHRRLLTVVAGAQTCSRHCVFVPPRLLHRTSIFVAQASAAAQFGHETNRRCCVTISRIRDC